MKTTLKIGTRGSKLALWQANWVKSALKKNYPH
ncbi:MAG: hydroxymethylbilane synthase, partial [Desulfobacterales bacterium]